jgi:hypothetical protein
MSRIQMFYGMREEEGWRLLFKNLPSSIPPSYERWPHWGRVVRKLNNSRRSNRGGRTLFLQCGMFMSRLFFFSNYTGMSRLE